MALHHRITMSIGCCNEKQNIGCHDSVNQLFSHNNVVHCCVHAGHGETDDGLHHVFKAAWEAHPDTPVPIFGSGQNIIPTIHVADLAAYVAAVCVEPPMQHYLLAVDNAQLRQRDIVSAIASRMGNAPVREQTLEALYSQQVRHSSLTAFGAHVPLGSVLMLP